jgi:hypothetical protein
MITKEHQSKRMAASLENLCQYKDEGEPFVISIIIGMSSGFMSSLQNQKGNSMTLAKKI